MNAHRILAAALLAGIGSLPAQGGPQDPMRKLAGDSGCTLCHREAPAPKGTDAGTPLAPSWQEIATRYRGRKDAEARLTRIVMGGADPRDTHWKDRLEFTEMTAHREHLTRTQARGLVRWILERR